MDPSPAAVRAGDPEMGKRGLEFRHGMTGGGRVRSQVGGLLPDCRVDERLHIRNPRAGRKENRPRAENVADAFLLHQREKGGAAAEGGWCVV